MRLRDQVAIVTGGASNIGRQYVLGMAAEGAKVVIADIDFRSAQATAREVRLQRGQALALKTDVSRWSSVQAMAQRTIERFGRIDILVNNAAMFAKVPMSAVPPWEVSEDEWDRLMSVNLKGPFLCTKAVLPQMRVQGKGKIINISSGTAFWGQPIYLHYVTSKAGVVGMTRSLARAVGASGINVNCIAPGGVVTETLQQDRAFMDRQAPAIEARCIKRLEYPDDLVGAVVFLASEESDFITGQTLVVDGGRVMH
ncbi:MAG: 3-oxoacyl-ACP reductase FabG [Chloroflexi bacterium]|nr:3-oxoacyl-ACP reductase FabG [Chloroflexota bacterium]